MKHLTGVVVLALCLSSGARARAYSLDNHARLTREAVQLVERCRVCSNFRGARTSRYQELLVEYNKGQDDLLRKVAMWHFPARQEQGPLRGLAFLFRWFAAQQDFALWTRSLWSQVSRGVTARDLYPALGAALHYVQDLAVPAHAVPVFHPALTSLTDDLDDYAGWHGYAANEVPCDRLVSTCTEVLDAQPLAQLLKGGRAQTRASLELPLTMHGRDGSASLHTWSEFWRAPDPKEGGFGEYDCRPFGAPRVTCHAGTYEVEPEQFVIFATDRARASIRAGARAIVSFERHLTRCAESRCEPVGGDARFLPDRCKLHDIAKQTGVR